jgi:hypothetical protein
MLQRTARIYNRLCRKENNGPGARWINHYLAAACAMLIVGPVSLGQSKPQQIPASINLNSSMNPSHFGLLLTFTVSVNAKQKNPTGVVTFRDGSISLGSGTLNNSGKATFSTPLLPAGTHAISARYEGDANFSASKFVILHQIVERAPTLSKLKSPSPSVGFGQPVIFAVSVFTKDPAPTAAAPTGMVTFKNGNTVLGSGKLDMFQQATFHPPVLNVGRYSIIAYYSGDSNFAPSTSSPFNLMITKANASIHPFAKPGPVFQ